MGIFKKMAKRLGVLTMTAVMVTTTCLPAAASETQYIRGTYSFGAHDNTCDLTDNFVYSDEWFTTSSYETNHHLAIMSMITAAASISSKDVDYADMSKNIQDLLNKLGFNDISVNEYYKEKMGINTMGGAVAYKNLDDNTVLLAIVPRSAGYESEWGGNFNVGNGETHAGFETGRDIVLNFAKQYVENHPDAFNGKTVKVWTMGYSRGAAVANLIGAAVVDDAKSYIGVDVASTDVYAYTFGTPKTVASNMPDSTISPRNEKYNGIHNYYADYDPVAMLPFEQWGYDRYGQDIDLDVHTESTKEKFLSLLQTLSPKVYENYTKSEDPDNYSAKTLDYVDGSFSIVNDDTRTTTQKDTLQERFEYLVNSTVANTDIYTDNYQEAVVQATALLVGGADETVAQFVSAAKQSSNLKSLAIMLFFYNWVEQYVQDKEEPIDWDSLKDDLNLPAPQTDDESSDEDGKSEDVLGAEDSEEAVIEESSAEEVLDGENSSEEVLVEESSTEESLDEEATLGAESSVEEVLDDESTEEVLDEESAEEVLDEESTEEIADEESSQAEAVETTNAEPATNVEDGDGQDVSDLGNTTYQAVVSSELYEQLYNEFTSEEALEKAYLEATGEESGVISTYSALLEAYETIAGSYMYDVLLTGLKSIGYDETHALVQGDNPKALAIVASQFLFGTDDKVTSVVDAVSAAINKVKTALTVVGNSSYMRVHNNEVILSWLRAMDTDPIPEETTPTTTPTVTPTTTPATVEPTSTQVSSVKTGDETNVLGWSLIAIAAVATIGVMGTKARKKKG